ncbi:hypothetical protein GCM10027456_34980 [Kineosporia babensis]
MSEGIGRDETPPQRMITGATLDPMAAGVVALAVQPLLRTGEKIRAVVAEDHSQRRLHVVTQQRCISFDKRAQSIASAFEILTVVRAELTQDGIGHRADVEHSNGRFTELRTTSAQDARTLGTAVLRACNEALLHVEQLLPAEIPDPSANRMLASGQDRWSVVVSRVEIRSRDVSGVLRVLAPMLTSPVLARRSVESVSLDIIGFEDRPQELWEIAEVSTFLQHLDAQFPYWFVFLDKSEPGLQHVVNSVLPPGFSAEELSERLSTWWIPALEQIMDFAALDEEVSDILVERSLAYLRQGPGEPVAPELPSLVFAQDDLEEHEPLDAEEVMGDLAELLADLPPTWLPEPEDDLLVFLWSVLDAKGLVRHRTQVEHVRAVASVLALHKLRSRFHGYAFGGGEAEDDYQFPSASLVGRYPRAEPFWIGVHAGSDATFDAPLDPQAEPPGAVEALEELARNQYDELVPALRRTLGENALFAALLASRTEDARYPIPQAMVDELRSSDLDGRLAEAWDWLGEQGR